MLFTLSLAAATFRIAAVSSRTLRLRSTLDRFDGSPEGEVAATLGEMREHRPKTRSSRLALRYGAQRDDGATRGLMHARCRVMRSTPRNLIAEPDRCCRLYSIVNDRNIKISQAVMRACLNARNSFLASCSSSPFANAQSHPGCAFVRGCAHRALPRIALPRTSFAL